MTTTVENILNEARNYLGTFEGSEAHHSIVNTYNSVKPLPRGYQVTYNDDWCDIFISFLAIKSGAVDLIGRECGVEEHIKIFKSLGIWIEDGTITPNRGDIITFAWNKDSQPNDDWGNHIGIVDSAVEGMIVTIEGNTGGAVRYKSYKVGDPRIRGYARPSYDGGAGSPGTVYNGGTLVNAGFSLSQNNIRLIIRCAKMYKMKPSFLIAQMFIESHWGDPNTSLVGSIDNNWCGISEPFSAPTDLGIEMRRGTARPSSEGGYYVHFATLLDFFKAFPFVLSNRNGIYKIEGTTTIEEYCKGLFREGGASSDFAESGYQLYYDMLIPTYNAIKNQNPGKLVLIDSSSISGEDPEIDNPGTNEPFTRIEEFGTFYPNTTINVRDYPSTQGSVMAQYTSGQSVYYDSYVINEGYVWLSYIGGSGERRYLAWRIQGGQTFGTIPSGSEEGINRIPESGTFYPNVTINVRDYPSTEGNILAQYHLGQSVVYDSYVINDGYVWLSYISYSGPRRYVAWRVQDGQTYGSFDSNLEGDLERIPQTATFYPNTTINVRNYPSTSGTLLAQYTSGDSVVYDSYLENEGYVWLSYIASSGARRYLAWRVKNGDKYGTIE